MGLPSKRKHHTARRWLKEWLAPPDRPLLYYKQTLGILPTRRFWRQWDNFWRAQLLVGVAGLPVFVLLVSFPVLLSWPYATVGGAVLYGELVLGLIERYVRKEARRRIAARDQRVLPAAASEERSGRE